MTTQEIEQISRKDRDRQRQQGEIILVAERIFADKGYHAATIEEIAKESQFAVGTLYKLFKNKDDLYSRVLEAFIQQFMDEFNAKVLSIDDPEQSIAALIRLRLTHFDQHRDFLRVALEFAPLNHACASGSVPAQFVELHDHYIAQVTKIFARGIEQGIFDDGDPFYLSLSLEGIAKAFVAYWSRHKPTDSLELRIAKLRREFLERIKVRLNLPRPV